MEIIKLGNKVKDSVSGLEGITTCRCEYLNGCIQYSITPKVKAGATEMSTDVWIDEAQLVITGQGVAPDVVKKKVEPKEQELVTTGRGGGQRSHPNM